MKKFDLESTEAELRAALRNVECERQQALDENAKARTMLDVAKRKLRFLVRDYPGDKEARGLIEQIESFLAPAPTGRSIVSG